MSSCTVRKLEIFCHPNFTTRYQDEIQHRIDEVLMEITDKGLTPQSIDVTMLNSSYMLVTILHSSKTNSELCDEGRQTDSKSVPPNG